MKHLTNFTIALAATFAFSLSIAASGFVVIKDTRQFDEHTASIFGAPDCKMPKDPQHVEAGECEVTKGRYVSSGEFLIRFESTGLRHRTVYKTDAIHSILVPGGGALTSPDLSQKDETYKCNADGSPVIAAANS